MKPRAVIILSDLWPKKERTDFELVNIKDKPCFKVKNYPIIGIHQGNAFGNKADKNSDLITEMFLKLDSDSFDEIFLALHCTNFNRSVLVEQDIGMGQKFIVKILSSGKSIKKAIYFRQESNVNIYKILKNNLSSNSFNVELFYNNLEDYFSNKLIVENLNDFQKILRNGFWHGPVKSMLYNFNTVLEYLGKNSYSDAIEKLNLINTRNIEAKGYFEYIKNKCFSLNQETNKYFSEMKIFLNQISLFTQRSLEYLKSKHLESNPLMLEPSLDEIKKTLNSLKHLIDIVAPEEKKNE